MKYVIAHFSNYYSLLCSFLAGTHFHSHPSAWFQFHHLMRICGVGEELSVVVVVPLPPPHSSRHVLLIETNSSNR